MANVLNNEKKQQILALGQLGWSLRRIQEATHVRRETISAYLKAAGLGVWPPGGWGRQTVSKPAALLDSIVLQLRHLQDRAHLEEPRTRARTDVLLNRSFVFGLARSVLRHSLAIRLGLGGVGGRDHR